MALAVEGVDVLEAEDLRGILAGVVGAGVRDFGNALAGIDFLHPPVGPHRVGYPGHQHLALVHHGDGVRKAEHAIDVVLDDQDRNVRCHVLDQAGDALALGGGKTGQRLVEQQQLRLGAERDAEIHQPLPAIGQFAAFDSLDAFQAEEFYQFRGLGMNAGIEIDVAPDVETNSALRLQRQPQVFVDGEAAKQIGDLERARQPVVADQMRRHALDFTAVEADGSTVSGKQAGYQIEQRGLAGAVRADQRMDFDRRRSEGWRR